VPVYQLDKKAGRTPQNSAQEDYELAGEFITVFQARVT
jgi:hypothetical protein